MCGVCMEEEMAKQERWYQEVMGRWDEFRKRELGKKGGCMKDECRCEDRA